jgi:nucleoside-diphosphate-sugar epimerase
MHWLARPVLVTGGASFIGSHLVEAMLQRGAAVRVVDDLSSGRLAYLQHHVEAGAVEFLEGNLLQPGVAERAVQGMAVVFHLAADHGGRGYVDRHQAACATNLTLDGLLFQAARAANVEKIVYASSGCVYPNYRQQNPRELLYLREDMAGPPYDADNMYGWGKLMGELTLAAFSREYGLAAVSCRYFTVYGERAKEDHGLIAMIARAFTVQDPFEVWGTGEQIRNWTYVGDIVEGTIRAAERVGDGSAINLGTMERIRVRDAVAEILRCLGQQATLRFRPDMPTGPLNRVADNTRARELLGWQPKVTFAEGLRRTIAWYVASHDRRDVARRLDAALIAR